MPVQQSEGAIEVAKGGAIGVVDEPKTKKLAKSKKSVEGLTELQRQEQKTIVAAAQSGYDSEMFAAAGSAYLQGGQQKMMEVIQGGLKNMIPGMSKVVGKLGLADDFDVWGSTEKAETIEETDVWA